MMTRDESDPSYALFRLFKIAADCHVLSSHLTWRNMAIMSCWHQQNTSAILVCLNANVDCSFTAVIVIHIYVALKVF